MNTATASGRVSSDALPGFEFRHIANRPSRLFSVDVEEWFHSNLRERLIHEAGLGLGAARISALLEKGQWQSFDSLLDAADPS